MYKNLEILIHRSQVVSVLIARLRAAPAPGPGRPKPKPGSGKIPQNQRSRGRSKYKKPKIVGVAKTHFSLDCRPVD